ncbi:5-oxoprolinase subunit PxpB [Pseudoalteromonas sp. T1lg65]|uniref:5-oxoprolinase subunit PxpB n=1 Tax=Pseudoalteromonas sp. T1lg65 TaxID=2077101 RepID=UPI003F7A02DD
MTSEIKCYLLGERALVIDCVALTDSVHSKIFALRQWLLQTEAFIDIVPAKSSLTAYLKHTHEAQHWQKSIATQWDELSSYTFTPQRHHIDVNYGGEYGPDLLTLATEMQLPPEHIVELHSKAIYRVEFIGFLPGFAYLTGLTEQLQVPRKQTPRPQVPKGSVAIADSYSAIYPSISPGGWHLIGNTSTPLFNVHSDPISLLQPGDEVVFRAKEKLC